MSTAPHHHDAPHDHHLSPDDPEAWDAWYRVDGDDTAIWSGHPNGSLVAEVADLPPGTALDVGCGEGADAVWLAERGWTVTALDPSAVAVGRARRAAEAAGVEVTWVQAGLLEVALDPHDLVSAQYPVLRRDSDAVDVLLGAVAPGGTLLVVHHELVSSHAEEHGFDPDDYVMPADVAARLGPGWVVEVDETRDRPGPLPEDARHVRDVVLRARRRE